jgi:hypothetical protein
MRGLKCEDCGLPGLVRVVKRINVEGKPWLCDKCHAYRVAQQAVRKAKGKE